MGNVLGPLMFVWFMTMIAVGIYCLVLNPRGFQALNPVPAITVLYSSKNFEGMHIIASVFLALTGAEALYADIGHFGKGPIRLAWSGVVFPALVIGYLGQGAWLLNHLDHYTDPFFHSVAGCTFSAKSR